MCEAFQVEDLALMIRATRGRSIDRWMDGWMGGCEQSLGCSLSVATCCWVGWVVFVFVFGLEWLSFNIIVNSFGSSFN